MHSSALAIALLAVAGGVGCSGAEPAPRADVCGAPQGSAAGVGDLAAGNTSFALAFFPAAVPMSGGAGANVVLSPYGVSTALTMTDVGAAGQTASQIESVLHLPAGGATEAPSYAALACADESAGSANGNTLAIANSIWAEKTASFDPAFETTLKTGYDAPLRQVDFAGDPSAAAAAIDAWASDSTLGKVPMLLGPSDVTVETRLVLADAIYFKGSWATQFDASQTAPAPFTLADGTTTPVETMTGQVQARASFLQSLTVLELPYKGDDLAMDFLMPASPGGLAAFESGLTPSTLATALGSLGGSGSDIVYVPKFSFTTHVELATVLESMGMTDAFDRTKADFSKMDGMKDLSIGAVVQQAFVQVDEQGTVAAAATAVDTCSCSGSSEPTTIHIDHPFLFLIRNTKTGSLLFMGQVVKPQ